MRLVLFVSIMTVTVAAFGQSRMDAASVDGAIYLRSELEGGSYLVRKVLLSSGGNGVMNFAGARLVSASDKSHFDRGYVVAGEPDDVPPIRVNGVYVGGNHGLPGADESGAFIQKYPAIYGREVAVDAGKTLSENWATIEGLSVSERYVVSSPSGDVKVSIRYSFGFSDVKVDSTITATTDLKLISVMPVQAGPLNSTGGRLMQLVVGSADYNSWEDISVPSPARSVVIDGLPQMAQRVDGGPVDFCLEVGASRPTTLNGEPVAMPGFVDISAAKKQYVLGYVGPLSRGDVIKVSGYRRYCR